MKPTRALLLLLGLVAAGCGPDTPPPASPAAAGGASSASVASAAPSPQAPPPETHDRFAAWQARPVVTLPAEVPARWRTALESLNGRVESLSLEVRTGVPAARRTLLVTTRLFGHDATVDQRIATALVGLGLLAEGEALPESQMQTRDVTWALDQGRLKAPPGVERETRVTLSWRERTALAGDRLPCKRPQPVDLPSGSPAWLARATTNQSTRRRVVAQVSLSPVAREISVHELYQNGYAHDGHVGELAAAAKGAGFELVEGSGPRQTWQKGPERFSWAPSNEDLDLGCTLAGPVLRLRWTRTEASP